MPMRVNHYSTCTQEEGKQHTISRGKARREIKPRKQRAGKTRGSRKETESVVEGSVCHEGTMSRGDDVTRGPSHSEMKTRRRRWRWSARQRVERHVDEVQRRLCQQSNKWVSEKHPQRERESERECQTERVRE